MTLRDDLEGEYVNFGGMLLTRAECHRYILERGGSAEAADYAAYSYRAVPPEVAAEWPAHMRGNTNAVAADLIDMLGLSFKRD